MLASANPMFGRLLESSQRDDSNKWPIIGFTEEITQVVPIEGFFFLLFFVEILTEAAASVCLSVAMAAVQY